MTEDDVLKRFSLPAEPSAVPEIRRLLKREADDERQGDGDTEAIKLLCVHLFLHGEPQDSLLVWRAKTSSMDSDASVDVDLLCGAGLDATLAFLGVEGSRLAAEAKARLESGIWAGDFEGFSVPARRQSWLDYYGDDEG